MSKPIFKHEGIHYSVVLQVHFLLRLRLGQQELTVRETKYLEVLKAVLKAHRLESFGGECV